MAETGAGSAIARTRIRSRKSSGPSGSSGPAEEQVTLNFRRMADIQPEDCALCGQVLGKGWICFAGDPDGFITHPECGNIVLSCGWGSNRDRSHQEMLRAARVELRRLILTESRRLERVCQRAYRERS